MQPVLFVPGNSGSGHQVRSIAAEAARAAFRSRAPLSLRFYTVDFKEDLSALDAELLKDQSRFVADCLVWLYGSAGPGANSSLSIVIGHSMGEHPEAQGSYPLRDTTRQCSAAISSI